MLRFLKAIILGIALCSMACSVMGASASELSPIYVAISANDIAQVKAILTAKPSTIDDPGMSRGTVLHWAAWNRHPEMVRYLLSHGSRKQINKRDSDGRPPIYFVTKGAPNVTAGTQADALAVGRLLLDNGADRTLRDKFGDTPLDVARAERKAAFVALFENYQPRRLHTLSVRPRSRHFLSASGIHRN